MITSETRERFLLAIATSIPADRVAELHLFAPIKQGGTESGVAVVAAWPEVPAAESDGGSLAMLAEGDATIDAASLDALAESTPEPSPDPDARERRPVIYTARYRLALKGPDRGKWETNVVAEADAPLVTVEAVVRGVQRRSGDVEDPARMDGDEFRALVASKAPAQPTT